MPASSRHEHQRFHGLRIGSTQDWVHAAPDAGLGTRPRFLQKVSDVFSGPLSVDLHDAILIAIRTGDEETSDAFLVFLSRLAMLAVRGRHPALLNEVGGLIQYMYYQATTFATLDAFCTRRFDETVYHILLLFKSLHNDASTPEEQAAVFESERNTLEQALWIILNLIRSAVDRKRATDAKQFTERLFEHERYLRGRSIANDSAPETDGIDTVFTYVRIVLAGWCITLITKHSDKYGAAAAVISELKADRLSMLRLIGVWELYRSETVLHAPIDSRIGIEHWDPDDPGEYRAGVGRVHSVDGHWIDRGLHALLLKAHAATIDEVSRYFPKPPPRFTWEEKRSREWLEMLSTIDALNIPQDKRSERIQAALSVIRKRKHAADLPYVERTIRDPIDDELWVDFVRDIEGAWRSHRHWLAAIGSLCPSPSQATLMPPVRSRAGAWVWRDVFIPGNSWAAGFGEIIGHPLANREAQSLFWCAQESCRRRGTIGQIAEIETHLQNVIKELRAKGYAPNLILLPPADRFACALFKVPLWNVPDAGRFGIASLGTWEGLLVMRWPYTNAEFVMVADAYQLFGKQAITVEQIHVAVNEFTNEKRAELLAKTQEQMAQGVSPSNDDIRVLGSV